MHGFVALAEALDCLADARIGIDGRMADQPQIETIVAKVREKNYGFRSLIHEIVQSELFQSK